MKPGGPPPRPTRAVLRGRGRVWVPLQGFGTGASRDPKDLQSGLSLGARSRAKESLLPPFPSVSSPGKQEVKGDKKDKGKAKVTWADQRGPRFGSGWRGEVAGDSVGPPPLVLAPRGFHRRLQRLVSRPESY